MEKYENPQMEIIALNGEDIIVTSVVDDDDTMTPEVPVSDGGN